MLRRNRKQNRRKNSQKRKSTERRLQLLETLEDRRLMAVAGGFDEQLGRIHSNRSEYSHYRDGRVEVGQYRLNRTSLRQAALANPPQQINPAVTETKQSDNQESEVAEVTETTPQPEAVEENGVGDNPAATTAQPIEPAVSQPVTTVSNESNTGNIIPVTEIKPPPAIRYLDSDRDGILDRKYVDRNHDGIPDSVFYDTNQDGIEEFEMHDKNNDRVMDYGYFDKDGDGIMDDYWLDGNGDGRPQEEEVSPIPKPKPLPPNDTMAFDSVPDAEAISLEKDPLDKSSQTEKQAAVATTVSRRQEADSARDRRGRRSRKTSPLVDDRQNRLGGDDDENQPQVDDKNPADGAEDKPAAENNAQPKTGWFGSIIDSINQTTIRVIDNSIERVIEALGNQNYQTREAASEALTNLGERAVPFLLKALQSDDPEIEHRAKTALDAIIYECAQATLDQRNDIVEQLSSLNDQIDRLETQHWVVKGLLDSIAPEFEQQRASLQVTLFNNEDRQQLLRDQIGELEQQADDLKDKLHNDFGMDENGKIIKPTDEIIRGLFGLSPAESRSLAEEDSPENHDDHEESDNSQVADETSDSNDSSELHKKDPKSSEERSKAKKTSQPKKEVKDTSTTSRGRESDSRSDRRGRRSRKTSPLVDNRTNSPNGDDEDKKPAVEEESAEDQLGPVEKLQQERDKLHRQRRENQRKQLELAGPDGGGRIERQDREKYNRLVEEEKQFDSKLAELDQQLEEAGVPPKNAEELEKQRKQIQDQGVELDIQQRDLERGEMGSEEWKEWEKLELEKNLNAYDWWLVDKKLQALKEQGANDDQGTDHEPEETEESEQSGNATEEGNEDNQPAVPQPEEPSDEPAQEDAGEQAEQKVDNEEPASSVVVAGGHVIDIPESLLIDLPANRLTITELFKTAPEQSDTMRETGLAPAGADGSKADSDTAEEAVEDQAKTTDSVSRDRQSRATRNGRHQHSYQVRPVREQVIDQVFATNDFYDDLRGVNDNNFAITPAIAGNNNGDQEKEPAIEDNAAQEKANPENAQPDNNQDQPTENNDDQPADEEAPGQKSPAEDEDASGDPATDVIDDQGENGKGNENGQQEDPQKIEEDISGLGSGEWEVRNDSTEALKNSSAAAIPYLVDTLEETHDLEVRWRTRVVLETLHQKLTDIHICNNRYINVKGKLPPHMIKDAIITVSTKTPGQDHFEDQTHRAYEPITVSEDGSFTVRGNFNDGFSRPAEAIVILVNGEEWIEVDPSQTTHPGADCDELSVDLGQRDRRRVHRRGR